MSSGPAKHCLQTYHAHRNWLKIEEVPFLHASLTSNAVGHRRYDVQVPWIGIEVVVIKAHHVWRGSQAIVKDVINNQLTASGLKVEVELARYGPSDTFRRLILDHEDVVEQKYGPLTANNMTLTLALVPR